MFRLKEGEMKGMTTGIIAVIESMITTREMITIGMVITNARIIIQTTGSIRKKFPRAAGEFF